MLSLNHGIRFSMRLVRRVEHNFGGRIRRASSELRRRLPGLLQTECSEHRVRQLVAGILYHRGAGVKGPASDLRQTDLYPSEESCLSDVRSPRQLAIRLCSRYSEQFTRIGKDAPQWQLVTALAEWSPTTW